MTFTKEQLVKIIESADEVISACDGTNEDVHPESDDMLRLWDHLNDVAAPPEVVRRLAEIALAALESRADAEPAEIDERAAFNAWNNDTDCPLAGRDAKSAAWLAWSRRAAMLAAAPKQEEQKKK